VPRPRVAVVVVARAGSSRLPGKMLAPLGDGSVLSCALQRCMAIESADEIIMATTTSPADDQLALEAKRLGVRVTRGSEQDVVARMMQALDELETPCDVLVRACADNPFFMPSLVDAAIRELIQTSSDLITPFEFATLPFGYGLVVMTSECLGRIDAQATDAVYREHVENFCFESPDQFHVRYQVASESLAWPELCLTLDYDVDLLRLRSLSGLLEDVPIGEQPQVLIDYLQATSIWIEGVNEDAAEGYDLVLQANEQPGLRAPRGVLVVDSFQTRDGPRHGLRYAAPVPDGFPLGPVYLDDSPGIQGTPNEFLMRVAGLAVPYLLAAPARPIDAAEVSSPAPEKCVEIDRRRGFRGPGEEAFPLCVALDHAEHSTQLLEDLLCELEGHEGTELYILHSSPAELAHAVERLGSERVREGCPVADPFRVLNVDGTGQLEIPGACLPSEQGSISEFWRSTGARAARARALNDEGSP
jgi:spore coat polysaccharide biosynthesis protein SpsF